MKHPTLRVVQAGAAAVIAVLAIGLWSSPVSTLAHDILGDANCDDDVNSIDSAVMLQYGAGLLAVIPCAEDADVNGDTTTNSLDAALVLQYSAGLIDSLE